MTAREKRQRDKELMRLTRRDRLQRLVKKAEKLKRQLKKQGIDVDAIFGAVQSKPAPPRVVSTTVTVEGRTVLFRRATHRVAAVIEMLEIRGTRASKRRAYQVGIEPSMLARHCYKVVLGHPATLVQSSELAGALTDICRE